MYLYCTLFYGASHRRCVFTHFSLWSMCGPFVKILLYKLHHLYRVTEWLHLKALQTPLFAPPTPPSVSSLRLVVSVWVLSTRDGHVCLCSSCSCSVIGLRAKVEISTQNGKQACRNAYVLPLLHATLNLTCSHWLWHTHLYIHPSILQRLANYWSKLHFSG